MAFDIALDYVATISKAGKDSYLIVQSKMPPSKKVDATAISHYIQGTKSEWAWFPLAKDVARSTC